MLGVHNVEWALYAERLNAIEITKHTPSRMWDAGLEFFFRLMFNLGGRLLGWWSAEELVRQFEREQPVPASENKAQTTEVSKYAKQTCRWCCHRNTRQL